MPTRRKLNGQSEFNRLSLPERLSAHRRTGALPGAWDGAAPGNISLSELRLCGALRRELPVLQEGSGGSATVSFRDHADKVGIAGATFAALCCLGISAVLSVITAVGLGFLINDAVLAPLLVISIIVTIWGMVSGWRRHQNVIPLVLGGSGVIALFVF